MDKQIEQQVRHRAGEACEYCHLPERLSQLPFSIDHVIARQHGGADHPDNLALACGFCNRHKGPNIAGLDPATKELSRLFDPRKNLWAEHFEWEGAAIIGRTALGRTTVVVLALNHPIQLVVRQSILDEGLLG